MYSCSYKFCLSAEQLKSFPKLFSFIKMLLVLSHGQASVERGF